MTDDRGNQYVRVWKLDRMLAGDTVPLSEFAFGQAVPESFVFSPDGRYLYGSSYYTGVSNIYRYEVATGKVEAVSNAETGFFRPLPLADGRLVVLEYTGEGFVPVIIDPKPIQDLSAITFLGAEVAEKYPEVKTWQVPGPGTVDDNGAGHEEGTLRAMAQPRARQRVSRAPGLQEHGRRRLPGQHRGPAELRVPRHHGCVHAEHKPGHERAQRTSTSTAATNSGARRCRGTGPISTICSGP